MNIEITTNEANTIQLALSHLYEMHKNIVIESLRDNDVAQTRASSYILSNITEVQEEIKYKLTFENDK